MYDEGFANGFIVGMLIACVAVVCSVIFTISYWQNQATRNGAGHYNPVTATFEWNQPPAENK